MSKLTNIQKRFITALNDVYGDVERVTRDEINNICEIKDIPYPYWLTNKSEYRYGRGEYWVPDEDGKIKYNRGNPVSPNKIEIVESPPVMEMIKTLPSPEHKVVSMGSHKVNDYSELTVPNKLPEFVPFGFYKNLKKIIESRQFFPVFISGLSGAGKTQAVIQSCAELGRHMIRFNISVESDETDLIGGYSLIDGNTVYQDGPVLKAMKAGAVLLIDEIDRGSNKLMCLQGILEGQGFLNKKTGEFITPAPGFTVIATANTKGFGSDDGRYLSQIMDSAFLERFVITAEWDLADEKTEKKILSKYIKDEKFVSDLVKWSYIVKNSFELGAVDEYISTRRLVHIAKTYDIFKDKLYAIELCVSRYDTETKMALIDLFEKIVGEEKMLSSLESIDPDGEIPF